ncbi:hypothetical protein GCM10011380_07740 [Sphingomonas metalli]|uniref:Uncharacterized protein n=1 Tax=Sphingomonas metalli TaxID=1779358 RepID=A0A916SW87_9SPHN|nr:hypothetical protein [Sphingomonas metalli]GGB20604.1 hypothetical protein GCM10011380_07740 [Sphingomonas metalli]
MTRPRDPAARLVAALLADAAAAGCPARIVSSETRDWSSATFTGARHHIRLAAAAGDARAAWLDALAPQRFALPRQLLGDLVVERSDAAGVMLSALVLDDLEAA